MEQWHIWDVSGLEDGPGASEVFGMLSILGACHSCRLCSADYFWYEPLLTLAWCNLLRHYHANYMLTFHTYHVRYLPEENTVFRGKKKKREKKKDLQFIQWKSMHLVSFPWKHKANRKHYFWSALRTFLITQISTLWCCCRSLSVSLGHVFETHWDDGSCLDFMSLSFF